MIGRRGQRPALEALLRSMTRTGEQANCEHVQSLTGQVLEILAAQRVPAKKVEHAQPVQFRPDQFVVNF
jgi:hypothetical protein